MRRQIFIVPRRQDRTIMLRKPAYCFKSVCCKLFAQPYFIIFNYILNRFLRSNDGYKLIKDFWLKDLWAKHHKVTLDMAGKLRIFGYSPKIAFFPLHFVKHGLKRMNRRVTAVVAKKKLYHANQQSVNMSIKKKENINNEIGACVFFKSFGLRIAKKSDEKISRIEVIRAIH